MVYARCNDVQRLFDLLAFSAGLAGTVFYAKRVDKQPRNSGCFSYFAYTLFFYYIHFTFDR